MDGPISEYQKIAWADPCRQYNFLNSETLIMMPPMCTEFLEIRNNPTRRRQQKPEQAPVFLHLANNPKISPPASPSTAR
jgi:hypothetical protein